MAEVVGKQLVFRLEPAKRKRYHSPVLQTHPEDMVVNGVTQFYMQGKPLPYLKDRVCRKCGTVRQLGEANTPVYTWYCPKCEAWACEGEYRRTINFGVEVGK